MGRKGIVVAVVAAVVVVLVAGGAWAWRRYAAYPQVGSVYLAEQMCACVFVAGRGEPSCRAEFEPDIKQFDVKVSQAGADHGEVSTRLLIFKGAAKFERGYGCTITR